MRMSLNWSTSLTNTAVCIGKLFVCFCIALGVLASPSRAELPETRVWLKDGGHLDGRVEPSPVAGHIAVRSDVFQDNVQFDIRAVRNIAGEFSVPEPKSGHMFLIEGGTRITGELQEWNDKFVQVESPALGTVRLKRSLLRSIESVDIRGARLYSGPKSLDDWEVLDSTGKWSYEAGSLISPDLDAKATCDVGLPEKFRLSLSMSWQGRADFVLSLGSKKPKKPAPKPANNRVRRAMVQPVQDPAAVRLEMWDAQLAVVREVGNLADIAVLPLEDGISKFELTFYVDQIAGLVAVYSPRGKLLEEIRVAEEKGQTQSFAILDNRGKSISLDQFDVYEWDGHLPDSTEYPDGYVLDNDDTVFNGQVVGFDPSSGDLQVMVGEDEKAIALASVQRVLIVKEKAETKKPQEKTQESAETETETETETERN